MAKSLLPLSASHQQQQNQDGGDESVDEIISQLKSLLPFSTSSSVSNKYHQDALNVMQEAIFYIQDLNDILMESGMNNKKVDTPKL